MRNRSRLTRNRGKLALTAALAGYACRDRPILLIVEDLHWADQQVLAHLAAFASAIADGPGLLVMTSRVEGDPLDDIRSLTRVTFVMKSGQVYKAR